MTRNTLFGGALFTAGIAATAANAQFDFSFSDVSVGAVDYSIGVPSEDSFIGAGFWDVTATTPGAYATNKSDPFIFHAFAGSDPGSAAASYDMISYFTVGSDTVGTASWDITDTDGLGYWTIFDVTDGVPLLEVSSPSFGTAPIPFEAGKSYAMSSVAFSDGAGGASVLDLVVTPAPASTALLALAGFIATRRRR